MSDFAIYRSIPLTQGKVAWVDQADYPQLMRHKWTAVRRGLRWYAQNRGLGYMHRLLLRPPVSMVTDHINRDGLDNRRCNLRVATRSQNCANSNPKGGRSRYKGVFLDRRDDTWCAQITHKRVCTHLGRFAHEEQAARAYDAACRKVFGEFARPNFVTVTS